MKIVWSHDHCGYICKTCYNKVKKNKVLCKVVSNKISIECLPREFRKLRQLETIVVVRRILYKKVIVIPKHLSPKIKVSICNIPISDIGSNCNLLSRPVDSNRVSIVKLKRKVEYCSDRVKTIIVECF